MQKSLGSGGGCGETVDKSKVFHDRSRQREACQGGISLSKRTREGRFAGAVLRRKKEEEKFFYTSLGEMPPSRGCSLKKLACSEESSLVPGGLNVLTCMDLRGLSKNDSNLSGNRVQTKN